MAFNAKALGFEDVVLQNGGPTKDYCYLRYSINRKGVHSKQMSLNLDEETFDAARELFGKRCNIAVDDNGRIVIYEGNARSISLRSKKTNKGSISIDSMREKLLRILGDFTIYKMDSKIWAKGEAILFTPVEKVM